MEETPTPRNRRHRGRNSFWAPLVGGLLLIALGFGLGIAAGVAWEESRLVVGHVAGRAEEISLEELEGAAPEVAETEPVEPPAAPLGLPGEAEAAPRTTPSVSTVPEVDAKTVLETQVKTEEVQAKTEPVAPRTEEQGRFATQQGGFAIQVGAFSDEPAAQKLVAALREKGHAAYVSAGDSRWRVRVGPVVSRGEAERLAAALKRDEQLPTWVLEEKQN